ncbi:unnamed protein product [Prunus armeniaca]
MFTWSPSDMLLPILSKQVNVANMEEAEERAAEEAVVKEDGAKEKWWQMSRSTQVKLLKVWLIWQMSKRL